MAAVAGREAATATGDLLFSRAFAELARNGDPQQLRALSDASSALAAGELMQREDAYAPDIAVERYLERCELKTAALFEAACALGALARCGRDPARRPRSASSPARSGSPSSCSTTCSTSSGPAQRTGKARGTDLLDGTVTLPLILARERDERIAALDLASFASPEHPDGHTRRARDRQAEELCERIAATGALDEARERALSIVSEAKAALPALLPDGRCELLDLLADAVVERYC